MVDARNAYKAARVRKVNTRKFRKFIKGSKYRDIFMENAREIDVRDFGGSVVFGSGLDLNVTLGNGDFTTIKIRDLSNESEFLEKISWFNRVSSKESLARPHAGDSGFMYAFGFFNSKMGDYKSMVYDNNKCREYCIESRRVLKKYLEEEIDDIRKADVKQGIVPAFNMGGMDGISSYCLVSEDLINSAHYDLDTSLGISIFNEEIVNRAIGWYFVLPNTVIEEDKEKAIIIKLFHGCAISWDGRKILHCTALKDIGNDNHVYGNFFGGKTYT